MIDREPVKSSSERWRTKGTTVRDFYASLPPPIVVGIEATGSSTDRTRTTFQ
jgi:hypothetical protein